MEWQVEFHDDFESEFDALPQEVKNELLATAEVLENAIRVILKN
ncbi:hypothetical protein [Nostoc sp. CHAB 5715]|nr:hypothetical protein [Nostoc sp. CHAB 5715]